MSVDASQLKIGDPVTIHARIAEFYSPQMPCPVVVRLGRVDDRKRGLVVVKYHDIATHAQTLCAFAPRETVYLAGAATAYEFIGARDGRAALWFVDDDGALRTTSAALADLRRAKSEPQP